MENDFSSFNVADTRFILPASKKAKLSDKISERIVVPTDHTTTKTKTAVKAVQKEVKLPDWITSFIDGANQYYSDAAQELQSQVSSRSNRVPSQNVVAVSHEQAGKGFPRIESTPNLKVFDISTTPTPSSPKSSRKSVNSGTADRSQTSTPSTSSPKSHRKPVRALSRVESQTELTSPPSKTPEVTTNK